MASITSHPRFFAACAAVAALLVASCATPAGPGDGASSSATSAAFSVSVSVSGQALSMRADKSAAQPGDTITFSIAVRNVTGAPLENVSVDVTFPLTKMTVADAQEGTVVDDRISWTIPTLASNEAKDFAFHGVLGTFLAQGDMVRTVVSMRADGLATPSVASAEVLIGPEEAADTSVSAAASAAGSGTAGTGSSVSSSALRSLGEGGSSSVNPAYSFFLSGETDSAGVSSSSVAAIAVGEPYGSLAIAQRADQTERQAGQRVRYTITVRNTSAAPAANLTLQALFPPSLEVTDAGNGTLADGRIDWALPRLLAGQTLTFSYEALVEQNVSRGETISVVAQVMRPQGVPQIATTDIHVIGALPETGADDRFFAPREDTSQYLTPVR